MRLPLMRLPRPSAAARPVMRRARPTLLVGFAACRMTGRGNAVAAACLALGLAGCAAGPGPAGGDGTAPGVLPDRPVLGAALPAGRTNRANGTLAALFLRLVFEREDGRGRAVLTRYPGPVVVGLEGPGAAAHLPFVARLAGYLRRHAGIDIATGQRGRNLAVRFVSGDAFRATLPAAACALVSGDRRWDEVAGTPGMGRRGRAGADGRIGAMTIFLPADAPPHRVRGCLIEEVVQALGPVNDFYGLSDSIFNDDGAHLWPTRLDLLMLRVLYAPEMRPGHDRRRAEAEALRLLDRLNPGGRGTRARPLAPLRLPDGARWRALMAEVTDRATPPARRRAAAGAALEIAAARAPRSAWHCLSADRAARLALARDPAAALGALEAAARICTAAHGPGDPRLLRLGLATARAELAAGRPGAALARLAPLEAPLAGLALDAGLATLYALEARALARLGREAGPAAARARAWSAYAHGHARPPS